jgi:hypothetical protein
MSVKREKTSLSEEQIDQIVIEQADDESAWEEPIRVERTRPASLSIPADLAARAAFLARLHRSESLDEWLTRVIRERVELEEAAFVDAKQELVTRGS